MKLLFDNGDQHISRDSTPDLRLHRVLAVVDETLDAQMLLDPLEEQLDLPAALVQRGNRQCRQSGIVGQEHQRLARLWVFEADASQLLGIVLRDVETVHHDTLVADDAGGSVYGHRIHPACVHATLGSRYEERPRLMQREQAAEIQIASIHHIERAGFDGQDIQHVDLVGLAVRDVNEGRNVPAQVEQRMQLDRCLGRAKRSPWKKRQTQVYGRGIQGVYGVVQIDAKTVVAVQLARTTNQQCGQVCPDVPIASLVGIGQCRTSDRRTKAHAVQLRLIRQQTGFDVAQALAVGQLGKGHGAELLCATQTAHSGISTIAIHDARKAGPWNVLHDLREQRLARVHSSSPEDSISGSYSKLNVGKLISNRLISNRHQNKLLYNPRQYSILALEFVS